jgi:Phage Terminase/DDE domain
MRRLLKKQGFAPHVLVTDKLRSYGAAKAALGLSARHEQGLRKNNRAENSHQPVRRRERKMQRFKSPGSAQRFGQGYRSMSPAVRDLETLILEKKLRHGGNPVLTMCMANAAVERGDAGNRKLSKKRSTGRIDGAVALVMAIGAAPAAWTAKVDIAALIG